MLSGVFGRQNGIPDDARTHGFERIERGPLTVLRSTAHGGASADLDGITCVVNGHLYDSADLARELGVETGNSAELIARGYLRAGEEILTTLRGQYSLALWDNRSRRGLIACDLLAAEPLYYWRGTGRIAFASELRDLFALLPATPGPNPVAVSLFLTKELPAADVTLFDGVSRLGPGRLIELRSEGSETRRYWRPSYRGTLSGTRDELAEGLRAEFERSVRRRLSQRLSGVVLSGGLDSSIVAALASREAGQMRTYSTVFPGEHFDEGWKVKLLTDSLDIEPVALSVEPRGAMWLALNYVHRWHLPLTGAGALIDIVTVNEAAEDGADVIVDGQTGDETLGFAPYLLSDLIRRGRILSALRLTERWPVGVAIPLHARMRLLRQIGVRGAAPHWLGKLIGSRPGREERHAPPWIAPSRRPALAEHDPWAWKVGSSGPLWWRYLNDFVIERPHRGLRLDYLYDRAAAAGVRNGSPLYDFDLVDYCLRLPPELAFAREHTRPLARHAMRDLIPDEVRLHSKKAAFSDFCYEMLTTADAPAIQRLLDAPSPELGAYVDMDWVRRLWHDGRPAAGQPTGSWGTMIWLMVSMECWLREQADPGFVESMLGHDDVRPPSARRVSLADTGTFFSLAEAETRH